ncbi:MAG: hypothetical protein ACKO5K_13760 [Armatimonadota bacterium]
MGDLNLVVVVVAVFAASWFAPRLQGFLGWMRPNHQGKTVPAVEGIGVVFTVVVAMLAIGKPSGAALIAGFGAIGLLDDLRGDRTHGGFRGHVAALLEGKLTTGLVKLVLLPAGALVWGIATLGPGYGRAIPGAILVAGAANLVNLLDTRAGRARCLGGLIVVPALVNMLRSGNGAAWVEIGLLLLATMPGFLRDRRGVGMLGDTGANALGAVLAWAVVRWCPTTVMAGSMVVVVFLNIVAERISFHRLLTSTPGIRVIDRWTGVR